jgi:hypothetical protein
VRAAAVRYAALVGALLVANYALLAGLTGLGLALLPAKLVTEATLVAASYLAQRHLVFASRRPLPEQRAAAIELVRIGRG